MLGYEVATPSVYSIHFLWEPFLFQSTHGIAWDFCLNCIRSSISPSAQFCFFSPFQAVFLRAHPPKFLHSDLHLISLFWKNLTYSTLSDISHWNCVSAIGSLGLSSVVQYFLALISFFSTKGYWNWSNRQWELPSITEERLPRFMKEFFRTLFSWHLYLLHIVASAFHFVTQILSLG